MSGPEFFRTQMGHRFYEATVPKIADQLVCLNTTLGALAGALQAFTAKSGPMFESTHLANAGMSWKAVLAQIAQEHLQINTRELPGSDESDLRQVNLAALEGALLAAYRAGIAAGPRHLPREEPGPAGEQEREPR